MQQLEGVFGKKASGAKLYGAGDVYNHLHRGAQPQPAHAAEFLSRHRQAEVLGVSDQDREIENGDDDDRSSSAENQERGEGGDGTRGRLRHV